MADALTLSHDPVGPTRGQRILGLALSPLAGLSHLLVMGRYLRGTCVAALFVVGWTFVAAGTLAWTGAGAETFRTAGWVGIGVAIGLSVADSLTWLVFVDHAQRRRRRDEALRQGLAALVRDEPDDAVRRFKEALALDTHLPAIRFHLGVALWRQGRPGPAKRQLHRCVRWDPERAWADEARRVLGEIRQASRRRPPRHR
jgi:hypothetical protein